MKSAAEPQAGAVAAIVAAGAQAPSGDNCQPWRFHWDGACLRVLFDPARAASFYDVRDMASWISLGAVLENMDLAAGSLGIRLTVDLFPPADALGAVARATLEATSPLAEPLAGLIGSRSVNRRAYRLESLPEDLRTDLETVVARFPGIDLTWVDAGTPAMARLARLAAENDRMLFEHRALHDGLYRWLRWTPEEIDRTRDGMPVETLELTVFERMGFRWAGWWPLARALSVAGASRGIVRRTARIYARSGAIALLTASGSTREDFVRGGRAMQRAWLTATRRGVAFQPITGITFLLLRLSLAGGAGLSDGQRRRLHGIRRELTALLPRLGDGFPVMLFRLGIAPPPSARARRLPSSVLLLESPH